MRMAPGLAFFRLALFPFATDGQAALPPQWQRAREFEAVVKAAVEALGDRLLQRVERVDGAIYRI